MATMAESYDVTPRELDHGSRGLSCYTYQLPSQKPVVGKRVFVIPRGSKKGYPSPSSSYPAAVTETDRRYRINPELVPLLQNRHGEYSDLGMQSKTKMLPRTPGTASEFETECIRKIWTEVNYGGSKNLPTDHQPKKGTPEIKLGERRFALDELERRSTKHSFTLGIRAKTLADIDRRNRTPALPETTIRSQRAKRNELKSAQFYTAITARPAMKTAPAPVRALTQMVPSIPNLYSSRPASQYYQQKDLDVWHKEVKKDVPTRPALTIPTDHKPIPSDFDDFDDDIMKVSDPMFYKTTKHQTKKKFFIVDREWYSEQANLKKRVNNVKLV